MLTRRRFLASAAAIGASPVSRPGLAAADDPRPRRVLLRSSWQAINIGDVGHTPGVLHLLEQHAPAAEVVVWAAQAHTADTTAMLAKRFPKVKVVKGVVDADGQTKVKELDEAIGWADFL